MSHILWRTRFLFWALSHRFSAFCAAIVHPIGFESGFFLSENMNSNRFWFDPGGTNQNVLFKDRWTAVHVNHYLTIIFIFLHFILSLCKRIFWIVFRIGLTWTTFMNTNHFHFDKNPIICFRNPRTTEQSSLNGLTFDFVSFFDDFLILWPVSEIDWSVINNFQIELINMNQYR